MSLQSMLTGNWFEQLATAIPAIPATDEHQTPPRIATIARIAVANPPDQEAANDAAQSEDACAARVALFTAHGLSTRYATATAQKLAQRDLAGDDRRLCLECKYLSGGTTARRCGKWQALGLLSAAIPGDTVDLLQRCESFDDRLEGMA